MDSNGDASTSAKVLLGIANKSNFLAIPSKPFAFAFVFFSLYSGTTLIERTVYFFRKPYNIANA